MITSNVKISLDSDTATQVALDTNFTYDVGFNLPMPKLSKLELLGINGDVDITEALSPQVFYGNRAVNISLVVKNGSVNGGTVCDNFVNTYDGQRVRLYINNLYFFKGRLTVIGDNRADAFRQLSVTIDAEPLRYSTSYTPSASGADITPEALGSNLWSAANVSASEAPETAVTNAGGTISAGASQVVGDGNEFRIVAQTDNKLLRIYLQDFVNCTAEVRMNGKTVRAGVGSAVLMGAGTITINVFRTNIAQAASFGCTIREIATHTVINTGKSVPFTIEHAFTSGSEYKPKLYVNGTIFSLGTATGSGVWREYAPAMLKSGENIIAAYVDIASYDPAESAGTVKYRYRGGVL